MKVFPTTWRIWLVGFCLLASCASDQKVTASEHAPEKWLSQFEGMNQLCSELDGVYVNSGEHHRNSVADLSGAFLSDLVFNRLPGGHLPDSVEISTGPSSGEFLVTLVGKTSHSNQFTTTCDAGWHVLKRSRTGHYLGDGEVEKVYNQVSYLRKGHAGELIVRVRIDAEFNSNFFFNSKISSEDWYRFQPVQ